jgi:hypothetical protein
MLERVMKMGTPATALRLLTILFVVAAGATGQAVLARDVYTWTDENGVVHFSDQRPTDANPRTIELNESPQPDLSPSTPQAGNPSQQEGEEPALTAAQQKRQDIAEARKLQREEQELTESMCERHRQRLEQMEPARRVLYFDDDGQEVRMDDGQRIELIEESRNYLAENCN